MIQITDRNGEPYKVDEKEVKHLAYVCERVRENILNTLYRVGRGHSGPSLSLVELLVTLYFRELHLNPIDPKWPDRVRFILSKGHGAVGLYSVFAERGLIPREELKTFESLDTRLQGSVDSIWLPWVEISCGVLLICGIWIDGSLLVVNTLLVIFMAALILNWIRGIDVDCGCFSVAASKGESNTFMDIVRDAVLLGIGLTVFYSRARLYRS